MNTLEHPWSIEQSWFERGAEIICGVDEAGERIGHIEQKGEDQQRVEQQPALRQRP